MKIRILNTEIKYEEAMARLSFIRDIDIVPGSEEAEFGLMALVIEKFDLALRSSAAPGSAGYLADQVFWRKFCWSQLLRC